MNSTELHILAGEAIAEWGKTHREGCLVSIRDGSVICIALPKVAAKYGGCLRVSAFDVRFGLTDQHWNSLGTKLMNLYNKEIACQKLQKPSTPQSS